MNFAWGLSSGTSCPPQPHLEAIRTPPFLMYLEAFLRGDQSMKVVSYDPSDAAGPLGPLSGTSCPPQPHLEVRRTLPFLMYLETFLRGDQSMKVAYCNPLDTPLPPGPGAINHQSCVCVWAYWVLIQILDNIWSQLYKTRYQWPNAFKKVNCKHGMILITVTAQIYLHFPIQFCLTFCLEFFKYNLIISFSFSHLLLLLMGHN